jgi:ribosomal protein L29
MKIKELQKLREKSAADLMTQVADLKLQILKSVVKSKTGELKNKAESKMLRRDLAQISSIIRQKEIADKSQTK